MRKFPIAHYSGKLDPCCVWSNGFTSEEIDRIAELGKVLEFQKGRVGFTASDEGDREDDAVRKTDITWIPHDNSTDWLFHRMAGICGRMNHERFGFDLTSFDGFQYARYKLDHHYGWHIDANDDVYDHRKLSFSLMLSDPEDYEGGELDVNITGNADQPKVFKLERGELIAFTSWLPHRVRPVTAGERLSMVTWAFGPRFK